MLQSEASSLLSSSTVEAQGGTSATEQGFFTTYILCCRRDLFYLLHSEAPSLPTSSTPEAQGGTSVTHRGSFTTDILYFRGQIRDLCYKTRLHHYRHPLL